MKIIKHKSLVEKLRNLKAKKYNKFITVVFRKRTTGELRTMNCRFGVNKGIKGVGLSFDPAKRGLLVTWDVTKKAYRMINLREIRELHMKNKIFKTRESII